LFGKGPAGPQAFWKFPQLSPPLPFTVNSRGAIHLIVASEKIPAMCVFLVAILSCRAKSRHL